MFLSPTCIDWCAKWTTRVTTLPHITSRDVELKSNFGFDLSRLNCIRVDPPWLEKYDGVRLPSQTSLFKSYSWRNASAENAIPFHTAWPPETYPLKLVHSDGSQAKGQLKSYRAFFSAESYICITVNEIMTLLRGISLNLTFDDLWWPQYWPGREKKSDALSNMFAKNNRTPFSAYFYPSWFSVRSGHFAVLPPPLQHGAEMAGTPTPAQANPRPFPYFPTFGSGGGRGCDRPSPFETKRFRG